MKNTPLLSITGADDQISPATLVALSESYPFVEWGILHHPEKIGRARTPTQAWRDDLLYRDGFLTSAHLCGTQVFNDILQKNNALLFLELKLYNRVQVNINSRGENFSTIDVLRVYHELLLRNHTLILQYNDNSAQVIELFLEGVTPALYHKIHILMDSSLGRGVVSDYFPPPFNFKGIPFSTGYAGGLSTENLETVHETVRKYQSAESPHYWLDLESGARTNNKFDLVKVVALLEAFKRGRNLPR